MVSLILGFLDELYFGDLSSFTQHLVIPNLYELISSVKHNLRKKNSHTVEIKSNQNGLVTLFKIFFCVQQKKVVWNDMRVEKIMTAFISSNFQAVLALNKCFIVKCFSVTKMHY